MAPATAANKPNGTAPAEPTKSAKSKAAPTGKKVIVRRLPPGMVESEFWSILGDEYALGKGKVDWAQYQPGFISTDPMNPSQPARAYLHLMRIEDVPSLSATVQKATWEDAKNSSADSVLVGPPYLDVALFQKVPTAKRRTDPRQGTIDQEPDFQAFLQSLTEPASSAAKDPENDQMGDEIPKTESKVTTTALVQYLKEKKANKSKETSNAKSARHARHESSSGKTKDEPKKKSKDAKSEKAEKVAAAAEKEKDKPKEPIKLLTKKSVAQESTEAPKAQSSASAKASEEATPKSRRANIAAAAKILQRDLGLSPGSAHRKARQDAAKAEAAAKSEGGKEPPKESKDKEKEKEAKETSSQASVPTPEKTSSPATPPSGPKAQGEGSRRSRNKGAKQPNETAKGKGADKSGHNSKATPPAPPVILKREDPATAAPPAPTPAAAETPTPQAPAAPTGPKGKASQSGKASGSSQKKGTNQNSTNAASTRGFVKHANASQGVTEAALKQSMETFGTVNSVEIDKRKGFAYVDFGNHEALAKAMAASPLTVGTGTVQVLERKENKKGTQSSTAQSAPEKPATEKAGNDKPSTEGQSERPTKRGGRGRGRRGGGGGGGNAAANAATAANETASNEPAKSASAGGSTAAAG